LEVSEDLGLAEVELVEVFVLSSFLFDVDTFGLLGAAVVVVVVDVVAPETAEEVDFGTFATPLPLVTLS
jgi:hypothetical protein